jgi:hypothetical protein
MLASENTHYLFMTKTTLRHVMVGSFALALSVGRLIGQSPDARGNRLLSDINAVQSGCSKAKRIGAQGEPKLTGVTMDITYENGDRRSLSSYRDSAGRVPVYVETLTTIEGTSVVLRAVSAKLLPDGQVAGILMKIILSPTAPRGHSLADWPRTSRQLTSQEKERVRSLSDTVLKRCTNA